MADRGMVYLAGAGPGDPGLVTVKCRNCLAAADVIVYDYLANAELLDQAPDASERIYVGKQAGRHAMPQDQINALLVAKAREGKTVVRLKGGDPYVFGRGGEEALALREAGLEFEVIPGITAAIAAPCYAGIPVTHRAFNSVLSLVTGHEDPTKTDTSIDWKALAAVGGTLAFYMGVKNLPRIAQRLIEYGRSPSTPIALIRWGTMPQQRTVTGTLDNIVEKVQQAGLEPPCMIVVGEVVTLRESLNWFEQRPLFGKKVVVTRSRQQASELAVRLSDLGAQVLLFPTIRFEEPEDAQPLDRAVREVSRFDWVVFTSPNAVDRFFAALQQAGGDSRSLADCNVCSIGSGTSLRLAGKGIRPDLVPSRATSADLFDALMKQGQVKGKRFLLPRADIAGKDLPRQLREAGADADDLAAYRTVPGEPVAEVMEALDKGEVDVVTFTSSSTARNYAEMVRSQLGRLPEEPAYVSIGPETSKTARSQGISIAIEAKQAAIDGLVRAVVEHAGKVNE